MSCPTKKPCFNKAVFIKMFYFINHHFVCIVCVFVYVCVYACVCLCVDVHISVGVCACTYVHTCGNQRAAIQILNSEAIHLVFWFGISHWTGADPLVQVGRPMSPWDPFVSTAPVLGLNICTTMPASAWLFDVGAGPWTQVLVLAWLALYPAPRPSPQSNTVTWLLFM